MDSPREQQPAFSKYNFLSFLSKTLQQMQTSQFREVQLLSPVTNRLMGHLFQYNEDKLESEYQKYKTMNITWKGLDSFVAGTSSAFSSLDLFSSLLIDIKAIGRQNKNKELHYFYEFVNDSFLYSGGDKPDFMYVLKDRLKFLQELKNQVDGFCAKHKPGTSEGIEKLQTLLSDLDNVSKADLGFEDQLKIYQMFHGCKNTLQAKQDQYFTRTRHEGATRIYKFMEEALPFVGIKSNLTKADIIVEIDSFTMIEQSLQSEPPPKSQQTMPNKPDLPRRGSSLSAEDSVKPIEKPPLPARKRTSSMSAEDARRSPLPTPLSEGKTKKTDDSDVELEDLGNRNSPK